MGCHGRRLHSLTDAWLGREEVSGPDAPCFPLLSKLLASCFFFFFFFLPVLKELCGLDHGRVSWGHSINSSWAVSLGKWEASGSPALVSGASKACGWKGRVSRPEEKEGYYELIETTKEYRSEE